MTEREAQRKIRDRRLLDWVGAGTTVLMGSVFTAGGISQMDADNSRGLSWLLPAISYLLPGIVIIAASIFWMVHIQKKAPLQFLTDEEKRSVEDFMRQEEPMPSDDRLRPA